MRDCIAVEIAEIQTGCAVTPPPVAEAGLANEQREQVHQSVV